MNEEAEVEEAQNVPIEEAMEQARIAIDAEAELYWCDEDKCEWAGTEPTREPDGVVRCPACGSTAIVEPKSDSPAAAPCWCGLTHPAGVEHVQLEDAPPAEAAAPAQAELFPPPPPPPFDFEKAYEELARADQRARLKKGVWESCKRDTSEARKEYDEALEDLHTAFQRVDTELRVAERAKEFKQPVLVPVKDAAPAAESAEGETEPPEDDTTKGGENVSDDMEATIDPEETQGEEVPDEPTEPETKPVD